MEVSQEELKRYEELQILALDFARVGKTQDLKAMLEAGMSVNLTDHKGNTLLMLASYNGNFETTKMLLEYKAEVDRKNDRGQTPPDFVAFLIKKVRIPIIKALRLFLSHFWVTHVIIVHVCKKKNKLKWLNKCPNFRKN